MTVKQAHGKECRRFYRETPVGVNLETFAIKIGRYTFIT